MNEQGGIAIARSLTNLRRLELEYCPISEVACLAGLKDLEVLNLNFTGAADRGIVALANGLKKLHTLFLVDTSIRDDGAAALSQLASLRVLDLSGTSLGTQGILALLQSEATNHLLELYLRRLPMEDATLYSLVAKEWNPAIVEINADWAETEYAKEAFGEKWSLENGHKVYPFDYVS